MPWTFARAFLLSCFLPAAALAQNVSSMVGVWQGEDTQQRPGILSQWISEFRADGKYSIKFQSYENCRLMTRSFDEGRWEFDGKLLVLSRDYRNGQPSDHVQRYEMQDVGAEVQRYRNMRNNDTFESKRVGADFQFPAPSCAAQ